MQTWRDKQILQLEMEEMSYMFGSSLRRNFTNSNLMIFFLIKPLKTQLNVTLGTMQADKYRSPSNRQTQTHPSHCPTEKHDMSHDTSKSNLSWIFSKWIYEINLKILQRLVNVCANFGVHAAKRWYQGWINDAPIYTWEPTIMAWGR